MKLPVLHKSRTFTYFGIQLTTDLFTSLIRYMSEPSLQSIFGANATQTATTVTLTKADFASTGFTPSNSNTAESILGAVVGFAQNTLTAANQASNPDQSVIITDSNDNIVTRSGVPYRRKTKVVAFDKVDNGSIFNPNDY